MKWGLFIISMIAMVAVKANYINCPYSYQRIGKMCTQAYASQRIVQSEPQASKYVESYSVQVGPKCAEGWSLSGNKCAQTKTEEPQCSDGTVENGRCITRVPPKCSNGEESVNGRCENVNKVPGSCPMGYVPRDNQCVSTVKPCVNGYVLVGSMCEKTRPLMCHYGYLADGQCVSTTHSLPTCSYGYHFDGSSCIMEKSACPPGYSYSNDKCVLIIYYNGHYEQHVTSPPVVEYVAEQRCPTQGCTPQWNCYNGICK